MKKVLVVLAGGGHTTETAMLVRMLGPGYKYCYVICKGDVISPSHIPFEGNISEVREPGRWDKGAFKFLWKSMVSFFSALAVVLKENPDAVISVGKDITVPLTLSARIFGKKIIYSESMQLVYAKSLTGRIVEHYADLFFVQWPEMKELYPDAIYAGRMA